MTDNEKKYDENIEYITIIINYLKQSCLHISRFTIKFANLISLINHYFYYFHFIYFEDFFDLFFTAHRKCEKFSVCKRKFVKKSRSLLQRDV